MLAVNGYYENGVCIPAELPTIEKRQHVIITFIDEPSPPERSKAQILAELRSFCHPGKHSWTEALADYIRKMRDEDRE